MSIANQNHSTRPSVHPREQRLPSTVDIDLRARETVYLPTLFDRLCDDMPSERSEAPEVYSYKRSQLRAIVQRDLAYLLNTTREQPTKGHPHTASSTLHYGVAPLAGGYLSETKWAQVEQVIRQAILDFEPRLDPQTLQVRPLNKEHDSANYNVLTFEIAGHIQMQPYPIEFLVQSAVDLENSRIELQDPRR